MKLGVNAMSAPVPLLSIIVVCKNPGPRLPLALESVWNQTAPVYEIVVFDGASTDGSREWLRARENQLGRLVSEPDEGVYAAMNKGIALARGSWILFLGADDRLCNDGVLARITPQLNATPADVMCAHARFDDGRRYAPALDHPAQRNFLHHQATFYRKDVFTKHGTFDPTLAIMADYDFNLRLLVKNVRFATSSDEISLCASGGLSDSGAWQGYREEITVRHRHLPAWRAWLWDIGSVVRWLRKGIIRRGRDA